jgi:hypothetical protein
MKAESTDKLAEGRRRIEREKLREWSEVFLGIDCIVHGLSNNNASSSQVSSKLALLNTRTKYSAQPKRVNNIKQRSRDYRGEECPRSFVEFL